MPRIVLAAVAASVVVVGALATPVQAQQTTTQTCKRNFVGGGETCTTTVQNGTGQAPQKITRQEAIDETARIAKWEEVCKPRISRDRYGVARYSYAQPDCEYGLTGQ
jgi:hypothetical protein